MRAMMLRWRYLGLSNNLGKLGRGLRFMLRSGVLERSVSQLTEAGAFRNPREAMPANVIEFVRFGSNTKQTWNYEIPY
jgi:hypothetical protein